MTKSFDIMTLGVPMVEFTRTQMDIPLEEPGLFSGPVPAGDPGIALNACVRLGYRGAYVGAVGNDAFGRCFLRQMDRSGIDTSYIRCDCIRNTGISMLTKFSNGDRDFMFTVPFSAAGAMDTQELDMELLKHVRWIHLSGFSLSISESMGRLHHKLIQSVNDGVKISFDPNFRKQIIDLKKYVHRAQEVLERCDCFLPSVGEACIFGKRKETDKDVCSRLSQRGKSVVLKDGARGSYFFDNRGQLIYIPAYQVQEVDSTGAGDCYDGAFIASLMDGKDGITAAKYATAAAAIAVTRVGLMDIAATRAEVDDMLLNGKLRRSMLNAGGNRL